VKNRSILAGMHDDATNLFTLS